MLMAEGGEEANIYIQNILDVSSWITCANDISFKQHQILYRWENLESEK